MRVFQFFLKENWDRKRFPDSFTFLVTQEIKRHLLWWKSRDRLLEGKSLFPQSPDLNFYADASDLCQGALIGNKEISGKWLRDQMSWNINVKELKAIRLGFMAFRRKHAEVR